MRQMVCWFAVIWMCGCGASFAPSLREAQPAETGFPDVAVEDAVEGEGMPVNPGFPSPVRAYGMTIRHSGHWQMLASSAEVELPDGSTTMAVNLGRDCDQGVAPENLCSWNCVADIMVMRLNGVSPVDAAMMLYELSGPESASCGGELSPLNIPRNSTESASYSWRCGYRTGQLHAFLLDPSDPESGIVAFGEWQTGGSAPLMEMQFTEMVRSVRLTE